jgi:quinol monooxygenase YgiN
MKRPDAATPMPVASFTAARARGKGGERFGYPDRSLSRSKPVTIEACHGVPKEPATMIHVLAIITAKPGQREAILKEFRANMPAGHAEEGCIEYGPAIDAEGMGAIQTAFGQDVFVVIEKWQSADALKAHGKVSHMLAYGAKTLDRDEAQHARRRR